MRPEFGSGHERNPMPMLPALTRWRNWPPSRRPARRWRLAERFRSGRLDDRDRQRPAGTVFRHQGRAVHLVSRHLTLRPLTYAPQFQLAFHTQAPSGQWQQTQSRRPQEAPVRTRTQLVTAFPDIADRDQTGVRVEVRHTPQRTDAFTPVTGLVARRSGASEPVTREITESVIERVIRGHQRIESRQRTSVVVREQPQVAIEVERALTNVSKRVAESTDDMPAMGMNWPVTNGLMAPNGPDLDQLTDQIVRRIDDRLTAQRERMGRF
jgi:hypothetical protein